MRLLVAVFAAGAFSSAAAEDDKQDVTFVPPACEAFTTIPGGVKSPVAWSQVFSFASCIQDARLVSVDAATDLPALVEKLDQEMMPALRLYAVALENGPEDVKVRAAYHVGMSQVALLTRLRLSAGKSRRMREKLEPLLEDTAMLAWRSFAMIELVIASDPSLAKDPVTKAMVRSAREMASALTTGFAFDARNVVAR